MYPSLIIVTIIAYFYTKYRHLESLQSVLNILRPAVVAMIASAGVSILLTAFFGEQIIFTIENLNIHMLGIFTICIFLLLKYKMDPIAVMILAGVMHTTYSLVI